MKSTQLKIFLQGKLICIPTIMAVSFVYGVAVMQYVVLCPLSFTFAFRAREGAEE